MKIGLKCVLSLSLLTTLLLACEREEKGVQMYRLAKQEQTGEPSDRVTTPANMSPPLITAPRDDIALPQADIGSAAIGWKVPSGWTQHRGQGMRKASFTIGGSNADISMIFLEGMAGGIPQNVNRWRQQIGLSPWSEEELNRYKKCVSTPLGQAQIVDLYDFSSSNVQQPRVLAAMLPHQHGIWFIKMVAEYALVEEQERAFTELVESIHAQ
jgi:hypothetical protein